jgi:hypothetical protein
MPNKKNLDKAKRERALKLLEESDPELAETLRDKLKEREERKQTHRVFRLPVNPSIIPPKKAGSMLQVWPLSIDRSFWEDWAFVKWQALRRNPLYRSSIKRFYKPNPAIFQSSQISHLFQDYSPSFGPAENPLSVWRTWAIHQSLRMKPSEQIEIEVTERLLAKDFTTKRVDLWPVLPAVCFPHPYFLDKLRPLPFAIPLEPVNRKGKTSLYSVLAETGLHRPRYLSLDVSLSKEKLRRKVSDYLKGLRAIQREKKTEPLELKATVQRVLKQVPRRAISIHADDIPYQFAAWDLKKTKAMTFREIAETLWGPFTVTWPDKALEIQKAQDCFKKAARLINSIA